MGTFQFKPFHGGHLSKADKNFCPVSVRFREVPLYSILNVWGSTNRTYLRKINSQQKHALRLIHNKNRFYHFKELFESCEILNVYKLNLLNTAVFMHKIKNRTALSSFLEKFEQHAHSYPTRFSGGNYRKPQIILRKCRLRISIRGPAIWNNLVGSTEKEIQSSAPFKTKMKRKLLFFENEVSFF